jgi:hypothetical protein
MFLAANECYWRIHFAADLRSFTCDKNEHSYGQGPYDWWRSGDAQNPEISLMGMEYFFNTLHPDPVYNPTCAIKVIHPSTGQWPTYYNGNNGGMWPFDYTQISPGTNQSLPGLLGYELDGCWLPAPCPEASVNPPCPTWWTTGDYGTLKLADSGFKVYYDQGPHAGETCENGHSYVTIYTSSVGDHGKVFATGSMQWNWGLDDYGYYTYGWSSSYISSVAQQMTHNVIKKFTGNSTSPK